MTKKILLASGCSYTDENYKSFDKDANVNWKMWPEILSDYLNLKCINKGRSGQGADYIFDSILEGLATYGNRIDTVAILWSSSDRLPFFNFTLNPIVECYLPRLMEMNGNYDPFPWMDDIGVGKVSQRYWNSDHFMRNDVYNTMIQTPLRKMYAIAEICEKNNIKLVMGNGLIYFDYFAINDMVNQGLLHKKCHIEFTEVVKILTNNPFFAALEKKKDHIIGWPLIYNLGGYTFDDLRYYKKSSEDYYISKTDRHPNKLGQEMFADQFIQKYKELYT